MAGDWIKVEVAALDKPEVGMFAELLGIPRDHAFGILVRFWMWLDAHSRDGRVTHVSRLSVDATMHTPGFAAALEAVGWCEFDETTHILTVPNFERHNGNSAKSRALHARRQSKLRDARVTLDASPEKRREEKISTSLRSVDKASEQEIPSWLPEKTWHEFVAFRKSQRGWTRKAGELLLRDLEKLRSDGHDPVAVIEQSIANGWKGLFAVKGTGPPRATDARMAVAAAINGGGNERPEPRDITTESRRVG